jgi:hypothetical protein
MHRRVDAAVPVDAQNAPTETWKTAQSAVSHSAHTHHSFVRKEKSNEPDHASHTKILTLPFCHVSLQLSTTNGIAQLV